MDIWSDAVDNEGSDRGDSSMQSEKSPKNRRKFNSDSDELEYLYNKILHWLYVKRRRSNAIKFYRRFERLLKKNCFEHDSIKGEEYWSLLYELKRDYYRSIKHRENEIKLLRRWLRDPSSKKIKIYEMSDLSDRMDLLAILYRQIGELDTAIKILKNSKKLCKKHEIEFDGEDLLRNFLEEKALPTPSDTKSSEKRWRGRSEH